MPSFQSFTPEHLQAAAVLLAGRHRADRVLEPMLPARFESEIECRRMLEELLPNGSGIAAVADRRLAGYLLSQDGGAHDVQRRALIPLEGHAIEAGRGSELYREMYASLATRLVRRGIFDHQVVIQPRDGLVAEAWFSLSFGQWLHVAARDLSPPARHDASPADIRRAGAAALDDVMHLYHGLSRYDTRSPAFVPYLWDEDAWRTAVAHDFERTDVAFWLAYQAEDAVGVMSLGRPNETAMCRPDGYAHIWEAFVEPEVRRKGLGTEMLSRCLVWAYENGFTGLTLEFRSMNLVGSRFWEGHGFRPVATVLRRMIDPRIAWADGSNE